MVISKARCCIHMLLLPLFNLASVSGLAPPVYMIYINSFLEHLRSRSFHNNYKNFSCLCNILIVNRVFLDTFEKYTIIKNSKQTVNAVYMIMWFAKYQRSLMKPIVYENMSAL